MGDNKTLICVFPFIPLRAEPNDRSEQVSQILSGELVLKLEECEGNWIKVSSLEDNYLGFADPRHFELQNFDINRQLVYKPTTRNKGQYSHILPVGSYVHSNDSLDLGPIPNSLSEAASTFLGTPYHWGGKTHHGIDCSGLTQICARLVGINLKRDAADQSEQGVEVDWEERSANDLAFFNSKNGIVTHVGILVSDDKIIHASGEVKIDTLTQRGIIHSKTGDITHKLYSIRRIFPQT
ncbi:MAG: hypothetical protein CL847_02415 [Crocinitomicaceae bacterium]|nr:hypothetical protein [Crocinitomicaceae bacterium]|tara:strand:- start:17461 stop:18174 length:714 start_codon:yes stop_codon:yes gene_type:complete